ncbi:hypothetical protein CSV61_06455 [Sporosarcina sp. P3]|uniref:hypothetical protein n=1 Tax=Sporosarcina sp. P3 TaxID=2048245 RepID=UPI000C172877|nr:hypothetical protein [Sporosarcina sp. P3]PID21855.1 hypothetical protein CSV61_06455 [Sporosarcina sp. P3]
MPAGKRPPGTQINGASPTMSHYFRKQKLTNFNTQQPVEQRPQHYISYIHLNSLKEDNFPKHNPKNHHVVDLRGRRRLPMDQPDQVRQPKESEANWLAHRGPMGKRPPGTQINGASPSITSLYFRK